MNRSTCYLMYNTTRTGLAAEMYHFDMDLKTEERMNSKTTEELHGIHEKPPKKERKGSGVARSLAIPNKNYLTASGFVG